MKITLLCSNISFGEESTPPEVHEDTITYAGLIYNFSPLPEGSEIEIGSPFAAPVKRVNGVIEVSLHYFYKTETAETLQSSNLEDYVFNVISGKCPCPIKRKPVPEALLEPLDE